MFWNNRNKICPKKPSFKKLLQILIIQSSIFCAIKTAWGWKFSASHKSCTPIFFRPDKKGSELLTSNCIKKLMLSLCLCPIHLFIVHACDPNFERTLDETKIQLNIVNRKFTFLLVCINEKQNRHSGDEKWR